MKKWISGLLLVGVVVAGVLVMRAQSLGVRVEAVPPAPVLALDEPALAARLARGLRIATVSDADPAKVDAQAFDDFHALLAELYPRVHAALELERIGTHSLLYRWAGRDETLAPALLAAHMDVVPIEPGTEAQWTHAPFGGVIAGDSIWGRGALDDKSCLMGLLESAELLLAEGFVPPRTLYLAFGADEEIGGAGGAVEIARTLRQRGVRLAFTLDEGSAVTQGIIAGVKPPVAAVMAGEKGYITFRLSLHGEGGHSSTPTSDAVIPRLARAVARLDAQPMPARLTPPVAKMLDRVAPEMPFPARFLIGNRDLFEPLVLRVLSQSSITNALIRTTQAITVFDAGVKDNVLPSEAHALVNYRLLPGDSIDGVRTHIVEVIDDPSIEVRPTEEFGNEAPPLSDPDAPAFKLLERTVQQIFPAAIVSSGIILATTDNRHYAGIADQSYYFAPFVYTPDDQSRIHGTDERIKVGDYANMVRFYTQLMRNAGGV